MAKAEKEKRVKLEGYDDMDGMYVPESWLPQGENWGKGFKVKDGILVEYKANAENVVIPEGITGLAEGVFKGRKMKFLTIPKSLTSISGDTFRYCTYFEKITVAEGHPVFHVENNCVIDTKNKTLVMGLKTSLIPADGSVEIIDEYAFAANGWGRFDNNVIPDSVKEIRPYAFAGCAVLSLTIPSSVKKIGKGAFASCEYLQSIVLPEGLTEICEDTFLKCECLKSIKIPDSVKVIGDRAFFQCFKLESVELPENLSEIGLAAFYWCNKWCKGFNGHFTISKNLKLASGSFPCDGVESITVEEGNPYYYCENNCVIETQTKTLVFGCKNSKIPSDVKKIGNLAFYYCTGLKKLVIPKSVEEIGSEAFEYCTDLKSVVIPSSVKEIGNRAFYCRKDCWLPLQLKKVTTPERFAKRDDIFECSYMMEFEIVAD